MENVKKHFDNGEKFEKTEDWGRKQLAYPIKKNQVANFLHLQFNSKESNLAKEITDKLRVEKRVLRYLLVKKA